MRPGALLLHEADVRQRGGIPLDAGACDRLMCDLPFGKQFGTLEDNLSLYPNALRCFLFMLFLFIVSLLLFIF